MPVFTPAYQHTCIWACGEPYCCELCSHITHMHLPSLLGRVRRTRDRCLAIWMPLRAGSHAIHTFHRQGGGRRYLVGDSFTAADLTFAALTALLRLPEQFGSAGFSDAIRAAYPAELVAELRNTPAGRHALRDVPAAPQSCRSTGGMMGQA